MQSDDEYYYSDFGKVPWSRVPEQFKAAKHDPDARLALAAHIWNAWKTKNTATLQSLGLKYF